MVPIITWIPWNPVATKNVDPYTESDMQNGASTYSNPCSPVNINPSKHVNVSANVDWFLVPFIKE